MEKIFCSGGGNKCLKCLGSVRYLFQNNLVTSSTQFYSSSFGIFIAVGCILYEQSPDKFDKFVEEIKSVASKYKCVDLYRVSYIDFLRNAFDKFIDDYTIYNNRLFISITDCSSSYYYPKNFFTTDFNSKEELLDAIFASSYIPILAGKKMFVKYKNNPYCFDGGFTNNCKSAPEGCLVINNHIDYFYKMAVALTQTEISELDIISDKYIHYGPTNKSKTINQATNQFTNKIIDQTTNQVTNEIIDQTTNQVANEII